LDHHVLTALPGGQQVPLTAPDPAQVAGAVDRHMALREFRARLYQCLTARPDACFDLCDAILCADHAVTSLVQLSLVPEFRRGHGALYDALAAGDIDEEALAALLTGTLPQLADSPEALAWVSEHDTIDYGLLDQALATVPAADAAQVREACERWTRLRFAIDATPYPRPDAECSPGRGHVHHDACRCDSTRKTIPGWEYQFTAALVFYADPVTWPGKNGRPGKHGIPVTCHNDPGQASPEPDETLTLPDTPRYGTVRVSAWRGVHPLIHGDRGWFAENWEGELPVLRGTVLRVTVEHLPDGRRPHKTMWLWHAGPAPLSLDELWRAYLARFDEEHAFKFVKGTLGLTAAKVRTPEQADRWVRLVMAAFAQLLLARPLAADLRRPWETRPPADRPLSPGRVRRGFANIRARLGTPAHVAKPARPGPGRPKGSVKGPAPRYPVPKKTGTTDKPGAQNRRSKVKT
jgi:hypothetical protein